MHPELPKEQEIDLDLLDEQIRQSQSERIVSRIFRQGMDASLRDELWPRFLEHCERERKQVTSATIHRFAQKELERQDRLKEERLRACSRRIAP